MTTSCLNAPTRSLSALREAVLRNIALHERAITEGRNIDWHRAQLAERQARLAQFEAELAHRLPPAAGR